MTTDIYNRLSEPFPAEMERSRRKGGVELTYIPVAEIITRMNAVLGVGNWDSEVINVYRDTLDPDFIVAHVRVSVTIDGNVIRRDGMGGQTIKRTKAGEIVDLGDEFKGAVSDAFKKACSMFGVGLYLSRSEDAMEIEAAMASTSNAQAAPEIDSEANDLFTTLKGHLDNLDAEGKMEIKKWWGATFPGERPPSPASTRDQLVEAISWCVERALDATVV